jgi:hypothetical protein
MMWMAISGSSTPMWTSDHLHVFDDGVVALVRVDPLFAPFGEGVGAGSREAQTVLFGQVDQVAADHVDFVGSFLDVAADAGAGFDDRLVHLGLDALGEHGSALFDHFHADVGAEVAGFGIDGLVFFLDADG